MNYVRDHSPAQQGLRPGAGLSNPGTEKVRDHSPAQQGLRPREDLDDSFLVLFVRDHSPAQQGLRPRSSIPRNGDLWASETIVQHNKD